MNTAVPLKLLLSLIASASLLSCTSARWTVKSTDAVDRNESEIVSQKEFLSPEGKLTPEDPLLRLNLLSEIQYEYPQRVLLQRTIQDYRLRPGFTVLGFAGAAAAFYAANSSALEGNNSSARSLTLNTAGGLLALSGFWNMKPVGEPRPTGEERHLRSTGTITETDTANITGASQNKADISVDYEGQTLMKESGRGITGGRLELQLVNILDDLRLSESDPGKVNVYVEFNDSTYTYSYPVEDILLPYAQITAPLTELRNEPDESQASVLAELLSGSQLQISNIEDEKWFRVLYGISEHYILRSNAQLIWRPSGFIDNNSVVTVAQIPFGNIDVEYNVPILRSVRKNAYALIITNEDYSGQYTPRSYSHRDGRLIRTYLEDALGYPSQNIFELKDVRDPGEVTELLQKLQQATNDSSEVFVYINGHGKIQKDQDSYILNLSAITSEKEETDIPLVNLGMIYEQLSKIPSGPMLVLNDISFGPESHNLSLSRSENRQIFNNHFSELTDSKPDATIITGSNIDQPSALYLSASGEDKKHHIFPYYFARALQQRITDLPAIYQFLERNVPYTSRRLHDQSQDPMLLGATSLDFTSE